MDKVKYNIPQAKLGSIALQCEYLASHSKMKPCNLKPKECILGYKGIVSKDGISFTPLEQPSIEVTLRNCPKRLKVEG